jgi:hypothetical protein
MDAITMLREDHRSVEKLFKRFEDAGPRAFVEKRKLVDRIIEELSVHAAIEEQVFYPVTRATVPRSTRWPSRASRSTTSSSGCSRSSRAWTRRTNGSGPRRRC